MVKSRHIIVIAGPNGAGKSTAAPRLLRDELAVGEFVNADVIALGLSGFAPEKSALAAGRIMLARLNQLAEARTTFAFETTLASRSFAPWLAKQKARGYRFQLLYLWLPSAELAIARVKTRVRLGGHDVPEGTIRRRYHAGLKNFFSLYAPLANSWAFYDNGEAKAPMLIAACHDTHVTVRRKEVWQQIQEAYA